MRYLFANCLLDTKSREFRRGSADVHLSPKAHDLLRLLITQRPRVVSKAELMQALWPETFVVEGNLPVLVAELRSAIGSRPAVAAAVIKTHHGIGYSFAAPVLAEKNRPPSDQGGGSGPQLKIGRRRIALNPGPNEIGRDSECDVHITDASVSRSHARITLTAAAVATLEDRGSRNGTKVNGALIKAPVELRDGDELMFGQVSAQYHSQSRNSDSTMAL